MFEDARTVHEALKRGIKASSKFSVSFTDTIFVATMG